MSLTWNQFKEEAIQFIQLQKVENNNWEWIETNKNVKI